MINIPMAKQPTRSQALEHARKLLAATCEEYHLRNGRTVYYNDRVQYIGEVNLQVSLVYDSMPPANPNTVAIPPANGKGRW